MSEPCEITDIHPDVEFWCLTHRRIPEECIRALEDRIAELEKAIDEALTPETDWVAILEMARAVEVREREAE